MQAVILEIKSSCREHRRIDIYVKLKNKYFKCLEKYQELRCRLCKSSNVRQLMEDLKERDEGLVRVMGKCSVLEGILRSKKEELDLSRG